MDNQSERVHNLFLKYSSREASTEEAEEFLKLLSQGTFDQEIIRSMQESIRLTTPGEDQESQRWDIILNNIKKQTTSLHRKNRMWLKLGIAASITAIFCTSLLVYYNIQHRRPLVSVNNADIAPGQSSATLTLANGRKIKLTDALKGKVAEESGVVISRNATGELVYKTVSPASGEDNNNINTLSTANGETYHLRLPDRSEVWLNAGSSLSYKASLIDMGKRIVHLTGEAYFEVARDAKHPFIVASDKQEVRVLGTHFNVNTYTDEPAVKTSLLEGSVQITSSDGKVIKMKPGQQVSIAGETVSIADIDPEDAVAWTKGRLQFDNRTMPEIMRQIAKWYDVQVIFDSTIPEGEWSGSISRQRSLKQVLRMLEKSNAVRFRIDGKKLYVKKYTGLNNQNY